MDNTIQPRWRIVKKYKRNDPYKQFHWVLQKRIWRFWFTVDWQYSYEACFADYVKFSKPKKMPDKIVWTDTDGTIR